MTPLRAILVPTARLLDVAREPEHAPIWSALPEHILDERRGERFDGQYGKAYDRVVTSAQLRSMTRRATGERAVLGRLDDVAILAYEHASDEPLLDVPCGALSSLYLARTTTRRGLVVGADISHDMLVAAARRRAKLQPTFPMELVRCDATQLPFRDRTFGTVLSTNGLHSIEDRQRYVHELLRVLRPGGLLVLATLVAASSRASRVINGLAQRTGIIPQPPPTLLELDGLLTAAGFSGLTHLGGNGLVALCGRRGVP